MVRTMQTKAPSSSTSGSDKKKRIDAAVDGGASSASGTKRKHQVSRRRTSLSQCKTASLRLFRRVAEDMKTEHHVQQDDPHATRHMRLSQRAHDHICFLIRNTEQQLFGQCRKLMRTRTMSPKLLTTSMFLTFDKEVASHAAKYAFRARTRMDELDRQYEAEVGKSSVVGKKGVLALTSKGSAVTTATEHQKRS